MMLRRSLYLSFVFSIALCAAGADAQDYVCTNCIADLSVGEYHSCALREDHSATCWGYDSVGQATPPVLDPEVYSFHQVSAGFNHTCAIVECDPPPGQVCYGGNVRCWGSDTHGQSSPGLGFCDQVDAGDYHTCGLLRADNTIYCFGANNQGQSTVPDAGSGWEYTQVSAGGAHTCAIRQCTGICLLDTTVKCWGADGSGQSTVPAGTDQFAQVSAGGSHTCAVRNDGSVACWGSDSQGQSTPPRGTFQYVSAGGDFTCGLSTTGRVSCWGINGFGQATPPDGMFKAISAGNTHACGLRRDGSVECWGSNSSNKSQPTAGLCGIFDSDFEDGGDCRWSASATPCWTADCDGDGLVAGDAVGYCDPDMPIGLPPECPTGDWIDQPAGCGAYDCQEDNADVFAGQTEWFVSPYDPGGGTADRYDYNCDGVEEKKYDSLASNVCCVTFPGEQCGFQISPGCDPPGWDAATVTEIPECGESASLYECVYFGGSCSADRPFTVTQPCR